MSSKSTETPDPEPEEIESLAASEAADVVDALNKNRTRIFAGIIAAAVAVCVILVGGQMQKQKHLEAAAAYTAAIDKNEIAALDAVLVNFPASIPAGNALLSKAELLLDQGKQQDALSTIEKFVSEFPQHPRYAQGLFGMANLYHVSGDNEKAKIYYEETIEAQPDGELTPFSKIRLGDLALEAGDAVEADQLYQKSYTEHPENPFYSVAEQKISLLAIGDPPTVPRPDPPKPEPTPEEETGEDTPAPMADEKKPNKEKAAKAGTPKPEAKQPSSKPKGNAKSKGVKKPKAKSTTEKAD